MFKFQTRSIIPVAILLFSFTGCGSENGGENEQVVGPCVMYEDGEPLTIQEVTRSDTGEALAEITLVHVLFRDEPFDYLDGHISAYDNLTPDGDNLICTLPCSFNEQGTFSFTIESPGLEPIDVNVEARFESWEGGCPGRYYDGTVVAYTLDPAND